MTYQVGSMALFLRGATELGSHVFVDCFSWDTFLVLISDSVFILLFVRFIAEHGASRLLEHVGQLDKIYKIPPPPGKTQAPSLRPLAENIPGPLGPILQHGSVWVVTL